MENYLHNHDRFWLTFEGVPGVNNMQRVKILLPWLPYKAKMDIMEKFCKSGDMEVILWLQAQGFPLNCMCYYDAIKRGNLNMVKWLYKNKCPALYDPLCTALEFQRNDIYDWFKEKGYLDPLDEPESPEHLNDMKLVRYGQLSHTTPDNPNLWELIRQAVWYNNFKFYKKYPQFNDINHVGEFCWHKNFKAVKYLITPEQIYDKGIRDGKHYLLKLAIKRKIPPPKQGDPIWQNAIKHGVEFMKFITENFGITFDPHFITRPADCYCNLDTLLWAMDGGNNSITSIMKDAAQWGNTRLFLWGITNNLEIDKEAIIRRGYTKIFKWAYEHNILSWPDGYDAFVQYNDFESIQKYCTFVNEQMILRVVHLSGQLEIIKFFADRCPTWPKFAMSIAASNDNTHVMEWIVDMGYPYEIPKGEYYQLLRNYVQSRELRSLDALNTF